MKASGFGGLTRISHFTKVSGAQLGKGAKRIAGCEMCNFMELAHPKSHVLYKDYYKTGAQCPRCNNPTVRIFDSQAEFQRACELKLLVKAGEIEELSYQPVFHLNVNTPEGSKRLCNYVADFSYFEVNSKDNYDNSYSDRTYVVEDVKNSKGVVTEIALHKMKHFELQYGIEVNLVGR